MGWIVAIAMAVALVAVGLYALLGIAIIVTALVEPRSLKPLAKAEPNDPEWQKLGAVAWKAGSSPVFESDANPYEAPGTRSYAESQIRAAVQLGFSASHLYKHAKGGIYKTHNVLLVSPSREILAVVRWGTTGAIRNELTLLHSALGNGRYLVTSDRPAGSRTPGFYDDQVYWMATFSQLVHRHEKRIEASGRKTKSFSMENPLAEYEAILEGRARFLVAQGEAYWFDPEQTAFRSTLKGALRAYSLTFSTQHVDRSLRMAIQENKSGA
jgi:hypothetical protein